MLWNCHQMLRTLKFRSIWKDVLGFGFFLFSSLRTCLLTGIEYWDITSSSASLWTTLPEAMCGCQGRCIICFPWSDILPWASDVNCSFRLDAELKVPLQWLYIAVFIPFLYFFSQTSVLFHIYFFIKCTELCLRQGGSPLAIFLNISVR